MSRMPEAARSATLRLMPEDGLHETYRRLSAAFAAAGLETPDLDARYLLQGLLQLESAAILLAADRPVGAAAAAICAAAQRRLAHEPVSRILGCRDFYGRSFRVTPAVLDPRADTETLVDAVLTILRRRGEIDRPLRIVDIGIGSGAILCTLLCELPNARGIGTDISAAALDVARENAFRLGVEDRCQFLHTRTLQGVAGDFEVVVSNPPYIPAGDLAGLAPSVRDYDPREALEGGEDGLAVYLDIESQINELGGVQIVAVEVGAGQAAAVAAILEASFVRAGAASTAVWPDLAGIDRCVTLERQS